jgi:hypothetical protein
VKKSKDVMKLQSNGGTMKVNHKASINGYDNEVWFSKDAITNIIALSNLIKQYRVTYDSNDEMFVVHREDVDKPNMEFKMHKSGLHYFNPKDVDLTFNINTVSDNKKGFTTRQVKGAEQARTLYATLGYPSIKDCKRVIQSNQIKDCPVTVQDVTTAHNIWGNNIAALSQRKDHTSQIMTCGTGLCQGTRSPSQTPSERDYVTGYLLCKQDAFLSNFK